MIWRVPVNTKQRSLPSWTYWNECFDGCPRSVAVVASIWTTHMTMIILFGPYVSQQSTSHCQTTFALWWSRWDDICVMCLHVINNNTAEHPHAICVLCLCLAQFSLLNSPDRHASKIRHSATIRQKQQPFVGGCEWRPSMRFEILQLIAT